VVSFQDPPAALDADAGSAGSSKVDQHVEEDDDLSVFDPCEDEDSGEIFTEDFPYVMVPVPPPLNASEQPSGGGSKRGKRRTARKDLEEKFDPRTEALVMNPGAQVDWSIDIDIAGIIPSAFSHKLKEKPTQRLLSKSAASLAAHGRKVLFLYDSGTVHNQVPPDMKWLLDNVRTMQRPYYLQTAGNDTPVCSEEGTLRFKMQNRDQVYEINCIVNPSLSNLNMLSADEIDQLHPAKVHPELWRDALVVDGDDVPIIRKGRSPFLELEVLSGTTSTKLRVPTPLCRKGACAMSSRKKSQPLGDAYDIVHRICAHAGPEACKRTAAKAKGLFQLQKASIPTRPCPCCALAKFTAPPTGQGELNTGIKPTRPGQVLSGDAFGPIRVPGLAGERYFILLVCQFSGYMLVRPLVSLQDTPTVIEEMLNEFD
jgi:hypothetical protein